MSTGAISGDAVVPYKATILIPGVDQSLPAGSQNVTMTAVSLARGVAVPYNLTTRPFINGLTSPYTIVGDGVTDSAAGIAAAIAVLTPTGGTLYLPAGIYMADLVTLPTNVTLIGDGRNQTIIRRRASSTNTQVVLVSGNNVRIRDLTVDGNKANNALACIGLMVNNPAFNVILENVEAINNQWTSLSGEGQGFLFNITTDRLNNTSSHLINCYASSNGGDGLSIVQSHDISIEGGHYSSNASNGIEINDTVTPQGVNTTGGINLNGVFCTGNTSAGISVGPWLSPIANTSQRVNVPTQDINITGCTLRANGSYGVAYGAYGGQISGCSIVSNSYISGLGGVLVTGTSVLLVGNTIHNNFGFGVDCGASLNFSGHSNSIANNQYSGVNVGGCISATVKNNQFQTNGSPQVSVNGVDGPGGAYPAFPFPGQYNEISGNTFGYSAGNGIQMQDGPIGTTIADNRFIGSPSAASCISGTWGNGTDIRGNRRVIDATPEVIASASTVSFPDLWDSFYITGTTGVTNIETSSQVAWAGLLTYLTVTNSGTSPYLPNTAYALTFAGGGGSGAAGTAWTDSTGFFFVAQLTAHGTGYTSAPTVTVATPGAGLGATFSAQNGLPNALDGRKFTIRFDSGITLTHGTGNLRLKGATNLTTTSANTYVTFMGCSGNLEQVS